MDTPLGRLFRQMLRGMLFAVGLSFFVSVLMLIVPLFTMQVYDRVMSSRSIDTLTMLAIVSAGGLILFGMLDFLRAQVFVVLGDILARRLNVPTLQAAVAESLQGGQATATQAMRDLADLRNFMGGNAMSAVLDLIWTPLFLAVLFLLHPLYGFVALGAAVLLVCAGLLTDLVTRRSVTAANDASSAAFAEVAGTLRHAEVIEAMGMMPAVAGRWQSGQNRMSVLMQRGATASRAMGSASRSLRLILQIAVLSTGAVLILRMEVSPGSMIAASILTGRLLSPFEGLIEGWRQWLLAAAALRRVRGLLDRAGSRRDGTPLPRPEGRLVLDRLSYVPPGTDRPVLRGITFSLEPGEVLGIVGPSGAGKSTLARMIMGLWPPTVGGAYLDGHSTYAWERESFGRWVGYLPQSVALLDGTVRENISRLREGDPQDVVAAARSAGVHEMIGRLPYGYDTVVGDGAYSLSGGQKQRLALARALYGRPSLLVLDEPNASLDAMGEQALIQAVRAAREDGCTVVLIAHRPSIMQVADKLLVLRDGAVEQFGPRTDLIRTLVPAGGNGATVTRLPAVGDLL